MNTIDSKVVFIQRLEEKLNDFEGEWLQFGDIRYLIDELFEYNRDGWLDSKNLIKGSSSWQTHRDAFDIYPANKNFRITDGQKKEKGYNKGHKYHKEYVKAVIEFRYEQLKTHYENNSLEFTNPITKKITKISKRENELREKYGHKYDHVQEELFTEVAIKFAYKYMDINLLYDDIHEIVSSDGHHLSDKIISRIEKGEYHK